MSKKDQIPLPLVQEPSYAENDFVLTPSYQLVFDQVMNPSSWPAHAMVLIGERGAGKTHMGHIWQEKMGASSFTDQLNREQKNILIDNADHYLGDKTREEKIFHCYNWVKEKNGYLLMTMTKTIVKQNIFLPDLRSRLRSSPVVIIPSPDDDLLTALFLKLFADCQLRVQMDVIRFLVPRIDRSFDSVRSLVKKIDQESLKQSHKITIPFVKNIIKNHNGNDLST